MSASPLVRRSFAILLVLFFLLQVRLWTGDGGLLEVCRLNDEVGSQKFIMDGLRTRNQMLEAEVQDLKQRLEALEERARSDLGMIKQGETFYQYLR